MQKTVFITGATGGLGSQTCRTFAQHGYRVAVGYLNETEKPKADTLMTELDGDGHIAVACNIDMTPSIQQARDEIQHHFGGLSVLVNNAGWTKFVAHDDLDGLTDDLIDGLMRTHVRGYIACIREISPMMDDGGCIVNISSIAGTTGNGGNLAYCAAKAGVNMITRSFARVFGPRLRVNAVAPGAVDTDILADYDKDWYNKQLQRTPMQRFAQPENIAHAVFACAEHLKFTTGEIIGADGGRKLEEL